ncbi:MAG TPA: helix-turn-helix transcriptional regulator [Aldersonia sp.]
MCSDVCENCVKRALYGFQPGRLQAARQRSGMSRGELGRLADIDETTILRWETGHGAPQPDLLARTAKILEIELDQLVVIDPAERTLADLRVLAGLTQQQLGSRIGTSYQTVSRVERGQSRLSDTLADRIAGAVGVDRAIVVDAHQRTRTRPPGARV